MANPTTNYGFVLPTSSDLVTDLPADFDVALQGVDTRLKALQPGTTLGDLAYSSATANTNTRLGIGTTGQVLSVSGGVPAWATVSSGGWTLESTTTLSGTSTSVTIPSGYQQIVVYGINYNSTSSGYPNLRFNNDGGSNYRQLGIALNGAAVNTSFYQNNGAEIYLSNGGQMTTGASNANNFVLQIFNQDSTTAYKNFILNDMTTDSAAGLRISNMGGFYLSTTAITSVQVRLNNNWSGGTILVYGVK
jgi:hypothetical protein